MFNLNDIRNTFEGRVLLHTLEQAQQDQDTNTIEQIAEELRMAFGYDLNTQH